MIYVVRAWVGNPTKSGERPLSADQLSSLFSRFWPFRDLRVKGLSPGLRTHMYPYVALLGPTYRKNSHANHTCHQHSHETACFLAPEAPSLWVRFPSPAPLRDKLV